MLRDIPPQNRGKRAPGTNWTRLSELSALPTVRPVLKGGGVRFDHAHSSGRSDWSEAMSVKVHADALERHRAEEESGLQESSVTSTEPVQEPEPEHVQVKEPEPEPEEKNVLEPEPEPQFEKAVPDSTIFSFVPEEPEVVAPRAEPESSELGPAPPVEPPAPQSDALHAAAAREAAPSPAEAAEQPAVTQEPVAPASCEYLRVEFSSLVGT
ncbi:hypothetical protein GOODEAATRI_028111 [Goodea atripinnis]|uniref:Uncharacterized protein n=1 Tax=Goodea atripinnis TaxID=208336 RepID=A0ABV0PHP4_9TELE